MYFAGSETSAVERISGPDSTSFLTPPLPPITSAGCERRRAKSLSGGVRHHHEGFRARQLTNMSEQWKDFKLTSREVIEWKSSDGTHIQGVLVKPTDYDPARKYPLLVGNSRWSTGFDTPVAAADRYYPIERFAAKGALILKT